MNTEIEVKFLNVDFDEIRAKLLAAGAKCEHPMRLMKRVIVQNAATGRDAYVRVRDEGDKVTVTYKSFASLSLHGASEIETTTSDFDAMVEILRCGGMAPTSYQETRRETWRLDDAEVVLDEWPWLRPYIEVEGPSEESVRSASGKLGFDWDRDAQFGDIMVAYRADYPHLGEHDMISSLPEVRFDTSLPEMFQAKAT